jgi:nitrogen fixation protein FixH
MNWGHKIAIVYTSFALLIVTMVVLCAKQTDIFLVSPDYYKDEINYQQRIDNEGNAQHAAMQISQQTDKIELVWNKGAADGVVWLFRPADANQDLKLPLMLDGAGKQVIPTAQLKKGLWRVKVQWQHGNKKYYQEQAITI